MQLSDHSFPQLVGRSEPLRELCRSIGQVAPADSTVLIQGESGTGKELVAQAIHAHSPRRARPFIKVNCAALPEALLESELFGHVRGAFTGAMKDRKGRFAEAANGTLLLDEVGSLGLAAQAKLLRVLQEKEFQPVGSSCTQHADVRILAADNRNLAHAVRRTAFREDLFYRLNVFPLRTPPLRECREDIPLLCEHFLLKHAHLHNPPIREITLEAVHALSQYHWPGNVRELENALQRALILETSSAIQHASLSLHLEVQSAPPQYPREVMPLRERLRLCEKQAVQDALACCRGVKKSAAKMLGIDPKNFSHLLHKHGLC